MSRSLSLRFLTPFVFILLFVSSAICAPAPNACPARSSDPVLPLIEKYKAPPYPKSAYVTHETYDFRIKSRRPVPPTLTDVFVCDVWQRITLDLKSPIKPQEVSEALVKQAFSIYADRHWQDIAGYRPWTHWNFIRGLKEPQRNTLVTELVVYIKTKGIKDVAH